MVPRYANLVKRELVCVIQRIVESTTLSFRLLVKKTSHCLEHLLYRECNILVVEGSQSYEGLIFPQVVTQYKDIFEGDGVLEDKLHLHVDQNVKPVQISARKPPISLKEKYKMELERLVKRGIIAAVSEPTEWISSTVAVLKSNGKLRACLDPKPLNKALKRNRYPLPTIEDLLPELSRGTSLLGG